MKFLLWFSVIVFFSSCSPKENEGKQKEYPSVHIETESDFRLKSDSISNASQKVLIQKLTHAMEQGGTEYAVNFCSEQALPLTDSLSQHYGVNIQRLSAKNRNPKNVLQSEIDHAIYTTFLENGEKKDTVVIDGNQRLYYKRINVAMPSCLQCHGKPGSDISSNTLAIIEKNYPNDLAKGYQLGDFRGMWKITF